MKPHYARRDEYGPESCCPTQHLPSDSACSYTSKLLKRVDLMLCSYHTERKGREGRERRDERRGSIRCYHISERMGRTLVASYLPHDCRGGWVPQPWTPELCRAIGQSGPSHAFRAKPPTGFGAPLENEGSLFKAGFVRSQGEKTTWPALYTE